MKTILPKNNLTTLVNNLSRVVSVSTIGHTSHGIHIQTQSGTTTLTTTNNEVSVRAEITGNNHEDGICVVPVRVLLDVLKNTRGDEIELCTKEGVLLVSTPSKEKQTKHNTKTSITCLPEHEFNIPPIHTTQTTHSLSASLFVTGFSSVLFATSPSTIKPELTCVSVQQKEGALVFAATDSFRLVEKKVPYIPHHEAVDIPTLLIPNRNAQELSFFLSLMGESEVLWYFDDALVAVRAGDYYITSRLVQGTFPDYTRIIPKEFTTTAQFLTTDLLYVFKKASVFSDTTRQISIDLVPEKNECLFRAKNTTVGEFEESLPARVAGESLGLHFNSKYINDCLPYIHEESVECRFAGPARPLVMRGVNNESFLYLVMPMNK